VTKRSQPVTSVTSGHKKRKCLNSGKHRKRTSKGLALKNLKI
jgi:hypothetical protein